MSREKEPNKLKAFIQFSYGTWGVALISFFTTPLITWLILPEDFGKASMFTIAYNLLLNVVLLGTDQSFSRIFYDKEPGQRGELLGASLIIPLVFWVFISLIIGFGWSFFSHLLFSSQEHISVAIILSLSVLFGVISRFGLLYLRLLQMANGYSILQIISGIINIITVLTYAYFIEKDFFAIIYGFLFANLVTSIIGVFLRLQDWKSVSSNFNLTLLKGILKYGFPFVPVFVIDWLFQATDRFFLKEYTDFVAIGLYSASFKLVTALNLLQSGFNLFWVPFSYEKYVNDPEEKAVYSRIFNLLSLILLTTITILIAFKEVIASIFSSSYRGVAEIMPFLLFIPIMYTLSEVTVVGINFKKKTHFHLYISIVSFISNAVFCFFLVPVIGVKGAAISTGLSYLVFFFLRSLYGVRLYRIKYDWIKFTASLLAVLITAGLHTFYPSLPKIFLSNLVCVGVISVLYRNELREVFHLSKNFYLNSFPVKKLE